MEKAEIERDELVFNLISDTYNSENDRLRDINDKASKIVVFVGILIGLTSSFGSLVIRDIPKTNEFYIWYLIIFIISILFLVGAIICAVFAYWTRKFTIIPEPSAMIDYAIHDRDKQDILRIIAMERSKAVSENDETMESKIKFIHIADTLFVIGIIITLIFISLILFTY